MQEKNISIIGRQESPVKTVLRLSLPAILEQIMFTAVTYVDTAMVGVLGASATAAVGINSSCVWLIGGILSAMGVGFSVQIAQRAGANDIEGARNVVRTAVFTCISVGIVAGILLQMIAPFIPIWMGGAPEVIPLAQDYVRIYLMGVPFSILAMVFSPTMRSLGNMKTPMILNISGNLINCVLNFLFIYDTRTLSLFGHEFTMWGAGWGVSGAAFGTAVSNTFVGLFMFSAVMIRENPLKVPLHTCLHPQKNIILRMIGIGTPVAFERAIVASGQVVSTRLVTGLGTLPLAAHHLANTAESISYLPGEGIAYAATTLVGQSVGAGDIHKAQMYGKTCIKVAIAIALFGGLVLFLFPKQLMGIFSSDMEVIALGASVLMIEAFAQPMLATSTVSSGSFRGAGDSKWAFYMAAGCMWGIRIPLSYILSVVMAMGLTGIWIAMCLDLNFRGLICLLRFRRGKWAGKAVERLKAQSSRFDPVNQTPAEQE